MIDHNRKLIFIHIPRTAGTSIEAALVGNDWWLIDPQSKHISASQARDLYGEDIWESYTKFTVVRNPWDRVVSMWATGWWHEPSGVLPNCSFYDFCKNLKSHQHERSNSILVEEIIDRPIDFILRFESLANDLSIMFKKVFGNETLFPTIPHLERREHLDFRAYYDPCSRDIIATRFNSEIRQFGYQFDNKI